MKVSADLLKINNTIKGEYGEIKIEGFYHSDFEKVYKEFEENFTKRGELGGSVCIKKEDEVILDLWGGIADVNTKTPWNKDTIAIVWSCSKGVSAFALHMLVSQGLVDLNAPVTDYWPEYGKHGKEKTTVEMLLSHQSGMQHFKEKIKPEGYADWDYMINLIEEQEPWFRPGTAYGYQATTYGWLIGEIVKRVTGKTLGTYIKDEICGPLNAEFWLGLPPEQDSKVAEMIAPTMDPTKPSQDFFVNVFTKPDSPQAAIFFNDSGFMTKFNDTVFRRAELGATNGYGNARGLATVYAPLANDGELNDKKYVSEDTLANMSSVHSASYDQTLLIPSRFGLGYMKSIDNRYDLNPHNREALIMSEAAFGHSGFGGSVGFADPEENVSFGYVMNKMGPGTLLNERGQSLVDAMYKSLGYSSNKTGRWVK